ncbi:sensor histidine kinase [Sphingobacterium sp. MYb382]|uniref:sensor histidine kinase n=1 Tax=Sphingobacterium sp. MYb382 TaxID=2745278 RepID=UPI0030B516B8
MHIENRTVTRGTLTLIHIGVWLTYWYLELLKFSLISNTNTNLLIETLINLIFGTLFFYTLTLFVLPKTIKQVQIYQLIWRSILILILCFVFWRGSVLIMAEYTDFKSLTVTNLHFFFSSSIDVFLKFGTYAVLFWFLRRQEQLQKKILKKQLEKEKLIRELLEAKSLALQAQINPHFLFNTLNFIYAKAISSDNKVINKTVLLLSDILRHSLGNSNNSKLVSVNEELTHIKKFYDLNYLRFEGKYYLNIREEGLEFRKKLPPLVLLTFFENMMKYGIFDDHMHPTLLQVKQS